MAESRKLLVLIVTLLSEACAYGQTNITATSFAQLRSLSGLSNANVTMAPGEYWINGDLTGATYLDFSGNNTVFDLSAAQFKLDTRKLAGYSQTLDVMTISGTGLTINGLKLSGHDVDEDIDPNARRYSNRSANYLRISGDNVELNDAHIVTAGSNPYGYGDAFGKGAPPSCRDLPPGAGGCAFIGHNKTSGVLLNDWGTGAKLDGLDLDMFTFGHGVYIQGFDDVEIRNSTVTGELFSSNDVINNPLYQEYGVNAYNQEMFPDILISGSEDGIRYYGDGNNLDWSENLIIDNVTVTNMREAFSLIAARGAVTVNNASAYGNETGFEPGLGTVITNSRADVTNGPLLYYRRDYVDNTDVEIELVGDVPQVGRTWDVAYINGENNVVTLTSDIDPNFLSDEAFVRVGQRFNDWRHSLGDLDNTSLTADGVVLNNLTGQVTVLGTHGDNVSGYSSAGTINTGDNNDYDGLTLVLAGTRMVLDSTHTLGNNGTAADGSLDANASIVYDGATLELSPGIAITDEKLTISGDGVDGMGALYSDGTVNNSTRFGSSNSGDESTIFLEGDASMGVGVAGNQLLVGSIQGTGDLTKRGPGTLSIEKSSILSGDIAVAQGTLAARSGVVLGNVTVEAGGNLAPGASAGSLTTGDLDLLTGSTLEIEVGGLLAGNEFDQLLASSVTLRGDLAISLLDLGGGTFLPDLSDIFTILSATSLTGAFDNVADGERLVTSGFEGSFLVSYDSATNEVLLSDFSLALLGDLDGNGFINVADWTQFKAGSNIDLTGFTAMAAYQHGDLNGDFLQSLADFRLFQSAFNEVNGAGAFSTMLASVPEPSTANFCMLATLLTVSKASRIRRRYYS